MRRGTLAFLGGLLFVASACGYPPGAPPSTIPAAPVAAIVPTELEKHGDVRTDDYYWLKDRDDPDVIRYLEAENEYTAETMKHTAAFQKKLFDEIVGRIKRNDESAPFRDGGHYYYERFREDGEYPIYCRKKGSLDASEEILLDVNELAEGHDYYAVSGVKVSSGRDILGYATDTVGRRKYTLRFKTLATGETLPDEIPDVTSNFAWAEDDKTVFYTKQDPTTLRWFRTYRHALGTDPANDELVYEEEDETFSTAVFKTKSKKFIMIASDQTLSSEYRYLEADDPTGKFRVLQPRERNHEYTADHLGDHFYIRTNRDAKNFRLMKTPVTSTDSRAWTDVIPHRDDVFLENFELFRDYLVVEERANGLIQMRIRPWSGEAEHYLDFGEPAYLASIEVNAELDTPVVRYAYASLTTPKTIYDYDMATRKKTLLKQDEVLGGFDPASYTTERVWATARDGVKVPISLVYRNGFRKDGSSPLLLYGYGSYGSSLDASFRSERLSLLDRGFVYAIAHVRGGEELGRQWYEHGKLLQKKNTFTDFIDTAQFLVEHGYADPQRVFAMGGSAGRSPDGRGGQHATRAVEGCRGRGAVRGRGHDHARRHDPVDVRGVRRVGRPERQAVLRLHAVVLAVRQRRGEGLPEPARDRRLARFPGAVLGAGQMGRQAESDEDRRQPAVARHEHGGRALRNDGPLQALRGDRARVRLHPRSRGDPGVARRALDPSPLIPPSGPLQASTAG